MPEKGNVPKHSVRGYLSRQSTEKLKVMLNDYLQEDKYKNYDKVILEILRILDTRFRRMLRVNSMLVQRNYS